MVVVLATLMGELYTVLAVVVFVPSVVKKMSAFGVVVAMATDCAEVYVPGAGENVGVAAGASTTTSAPASCGGGGGAGGGAGGGGGGGGGTVPVPWVVPESGVCDVPPPPSSELHATTAVDAHATRARANAPFIP
jgi:hypothetical protein